MTIEDLEAVGGEEMTDEESRRFLSNQGTGVLGLPTDDGPYLLPISLGYEGDRRLTFAFLYSASSRKRELSDKAEAAAFLVYDATSMFNWQSVVCSGTIGVVDDDEFESAVETVANAWHPDLLSLAKESGDVLVSAFDVESWSGVKHMGLPPGLDPAEAEWAPQPPCHRNEKRHYDRLGRPLP